MVNSFKALIGVVGIGTVSTGIYLAIPSSKKSKALSIKERLQKSGYQLLNFSKEDSEHSTQWTSVKEAYDKETETSHRFSEVSQNNGNTINGLKDACLVLVNRESDTSSDLEKARRWCVVPVTVASRVEGTLALLDTEGGSDSGTWTQKLNEHKNQSSGIPKMPITTNSSDVSDTDLKNKCKTLKDDKTFEKNFETLVSYFIDWCTKPKTTSN
ncbi:hypothetical protein MHC_04685 [Mycoplasma haemocanis str. Illinois]|uniref:Uncharacterized protein n=1 Tax=Mycoplasma haemocanis (strain Illinois) TaxID=1111676 RepID=H6N821_MYCHN|nr:hypothetical protein [Mycoplasma haemocanis]AEW45793.1 hypothetical protein MHC_04685 [Mycoplasma haemocanis str. Illinois]